MSSTLASMLLGNTSTKTFERLIPTLAPTSLHENVLKCVTTFELVISFVYYALVFIAIVFGNGLVIAAYVKNWQLRTAANTFILGLAAADSMVGVVSIPLWQYVYSCHYFNITLHPIAYELYITFDIFIGCASIFQLIAISLERCVAIVWPIRHRGTPRRVFHLMIVLAWGTSAFIGGLYPVQLKHWEESYTAFIFSICFVGPFIILFGVYVLIYNTATKSRKRVCSELARATMRREIRVTGTVALVTGVFMIAWFPFFVVTVLATYELERLPEPPGLLRLVAFVKALHYTNSGLNPIIYGYRNSEMGKTMRSIALKCFPLCKIFSQFNGSRTRESNSANSTLPSNMLAAAPNHSDRSSITPGVLTVVALANGSGGVESGTASVYSPTRTLVGNSFTLPVPGIRHYSSTGHQ